MQLGQPHRVEAPALGRIDLLERLGEGVPFAAAGQGRKLVKHAEFHGANPFRMLLREPRRSITRDRGNC